MFANIVWDNVSLGGAFILGTLFATFAVLRIVRAVTAMFEGDVHVQRRRVRRRRRDDDEEIEDT